MCVSLLCQLHHVDRAGSLRLARRQRQCYWERESRHHQAARSCRARCHLSASRPRNRSRSNCPHNPSAPICTVFFIIILFFVPFHDMCISAGLDRLSRDFRRGKPCTGSGDRLSKCPSQVPMQAAFASTIRNRCVCLLISLLFWQRIAIGITDILRPTTTR